MTFITIGYANTRDNGIVFDWYISEDDPLPGTPPKKILKNQKVRMLFRTNRDAQSFFDIITMAVDHWEIEDKA